jgi:septal ring factor EnvC (AmiA/AmiB activator)
MKKYSAFALFLLLLQLLPQAVYSQDFSSIDMDLAQLEDLINDTIANTREQQKLLEDLKRNLNESEELIAGYSKIIQEQENLLASLRGQLTAMSEIYRTQSQLSAKYARNSKFWRTFTLAAIPVTALISGTIVWAAVK